MGLQISKKSQFQKLWTELGLLLSDVHTRPLPVGDPPEVGSAGGWSSPGLHQAWEPALPLTLMFQPRVTESLTSPSVFQVSPKANL